MKYKINLLKLSFCLLICSIPGQSFAQRYYNHFTTEKDYRSDTLRMGDYTYICDTLKGYRVTLRNIEDHPGRGEVCYADGTPLEPEIESDLHMRSVHITSDIDTRLKSIVDDAFSKEQAESLNGQRMHIVLNISPIDGQITDVYFNYITISEYADIPIEVYRDMEVRFKNEVHFTPTELGSKLNYCLLSWVQCPNGRINGISIEDSERLVLPDGLPNSPSSDLLNNASTP